MQRRFHIINEFLLFSNNPNEICLTAPTALTDSVICCFYSCLQSTFIPSLPIRSYNNARKGNGFHRTCIRNWHILLHHSSRVWWVAMHFGENLSLFEPQHANTICSVGLFSVSLLISDLCRSSNFTDKIIKTQHATDFKIPVFVSTHYFLFYSDERFLL